MLEDIDAGSITLFGQGLEDRRIDPNLVRRHVALVFQSFNLFPHLSVLDNILLGPVYAMKRKRADVRDEALALLDRIGLRDRADYRNVFPNVRPGVSNQPSGNCWPRSPSLDAGLHARLTWIFFEGHEWL